MSLKWKDASGCGCVHTRDSRDREGVELCAVHAAEAKARHESFMSDMKARTARDKLEEQFV
jgi:hypothetical protein